jgi:hypothetical protein
MTLDWCEVCGEYVHVEMYECPVTGVVWWLCDECRQLWQDEQLSAAEQENRQW